MRKSIIIPLVLLTITGCVNIDSPESLSETSIPDNSSDLQSNFETICIDHYIPLDSVVSNLKVKFPEEKIKSIKTIKENNVDVMYVLNYDQGWKILATDDRVQNRILAYSEKGSFNPDNISNPGIKAWYEMELEQMYHLRLLNDEQKIPVQAKSSSSYEPYYWLGYYVGTENHHVQEHVDHILTTKWGQDYPWNTSGPQSDQYAPYGYPSGCLSVATAQILYHLQTQKDFSIGLFHTVTPSFRIINSKGDQVFSDMIYDDYNNPSPRWADMPKNNSEPNTSYVADLMVDIGYRSGLTYSVGGTGPSYYIAPVFHSFHVECDTGAFYFSLVKENLDNGYPVMVVAYYDNLYRLGHAWVIDGYSLSETITDRSYRWRMVSSDSLSYYSGYEYCYTEAEKQRYFPDANEDELYHIYEKTSNNFLRMNWGHDGADDDGYYYMNDNHWPVNSPNPYPYFPFISYNFRQPQYEDND